ncbi:protein PSK SIMULATOR 2-like [Salvia splendens]|uniref:protein PSK SIMULATOR 2-like n=1 Tax=Salvia splendens TaxID=180675 RepID=UPI001C273F63|nr:protein PSK SIMULATOR 2-like [Salvia splendens]XP_042063298.1 protein PSK SIMULATOR 2-like [Salvia splendens]
MGGVCSGGTVRKNRKAPDVERAKSSGFSGKLKSVGSFSRQKKQKNDDDVGDDESFSFSAGVEEIKKAPQRRLFDSGELYQSVMSGELNSSTPARAPAYKTPQMTSFLGKAGIVGLEKAVEVLDTLGSSMTNLNSGGFTTGVSSRGNRICILAFEVANTIAKGANLLQSLSEENVQFLKKEVLNSEGVRQLVSTDIDELLRIAASDKREEFEVFSREVVRFGNLCKDPQWHNLDRFFSKLDSDTDISKQLREDAEMTMQELTSLAQHTSELYHEFHALDRFEQDYQRKLDEVDSLHLPRKGESLAMLQTELKHQRKLVRSLKKKSLWSKSLEQVVEKLVDIVTFIHQEIPAVFGDNGLSHAGKVSSSKTERLGVAGLALHYANIITQIDNVASRPTSLPPNMRDTLYNGLPPTIKTALRSRLQTDIKEELTVRQIKDEMEKSLQWLVPVATDTTKAHQGFGWVGEWANNGNEFGKKTATPSNLIRLQTLYHADKRKVDSCILELVTWLHRLVSLVRYRDNGLKALPQRSPTRKGSNINIDKHSDKTKTHKAQLSSEDRNLLEDVMKRRNLVPGLSKSQEFVKSRKNKVWALSRSTGNSPRREIKHQTAAHVLDVLDGLDTSFSVPSGDLIR